MYIGFALKPAGKDALIYHDAPIDKLMIRAITAHLLFPRRFFLAIVYASKVKTLKLHQKVKTLKAISFFSF